MLEGIFMLFIACLIWIVLSLIFGKPILYLLLLSCAGCLLYGIAWCFYHMIRASIERIPKIKAWFKKEVAMLEGRNLCEEEKHESPDLWYPEAKDDLENADIYMYMEGHLDGKKGYKPKHHENKIYMMGYGLGDGTLA